MKFLGNNIQDEEKNILTETSKQFKPILNKLTMALSNHLGGNYLPFGVELNTLKPGQEILPHVDKHWLDEQTHRVHLVLETNSQALMTCGGVTRHFPKGSSFILNNKIEHKVVNNGATSRTHLVVDCIEYSL